tara:strand:+ start:417 stop:608 length:192 start_codon:yes stop_codon:yes gene_type:complete
MKPKAIPDGGYEDKKALAKVTVLDVERVGGGFTVKYFYPALEKYGAQLLRMPQSKFTKLFCAI